MPVVLVTDIDRDLTELFRACMARAGYTTETATGGLECLEKVRRLSPDVLVLDRELPWGGGDGVLACLREEGPARPPAVVLTTWDTSGCPPELLDHPVVGCLRKPFTLARLLELVAAARTSRTSQREETGGLAPWGGHGGRGRPSNRLTG